MKIKRALCISVFMMTLIMAAGCGKNENPDGRAVLNDQNNIQTVLEQGMSETGNLQENEPSPLPAVEPVTDASTETDNDCVDLTELSSTMVYSEVYNMMYNPENYVGKTVKMSGVYAVYHDEGTDRYYHACIISDATACCSQGIEFELTDDYTYPDDYPEEGGQICVTGTFDTYQEGEYTYCTLKDAVIQG